MPFLLPALFFGGGTFLGFKISGGMSQMLLLVVLVAVIWLFKVA